MEGRRGPPLFLAVVVKLTTLRENDVNWRTDMIPRRWYRIAAPLAGACLGYIYSMWSISRGST